MRDERTGTAPVDMHYGLQTPPELVATVKRPTVTVAPARPAPNNTPEPAGRGNAPWGVLHTTRERILKLFVVDPSSGASLAYIDGLRGLAAFLVIMVHVWGWANGAQLAIHIPFTPATLDFTPFASHGGMGVYLFYVLSGFLLSQSWIKADYEGRRRPGLKTYFKLRFFRLAPGYYASLFLMLLLFVPRIIVPALVYSRSGVFSIIAHVLFLQYLFPTSSVDFFIDGPMWSLTMEALFYVTLPVLVIFFLRRRWIVSLPIAVAISIAWNIACQGALNPVANAVYAYMQQRPAYGPYYSMTMAQEFIEWQFPAHLVAFALGITLANLYTRRRLRIASGQMFATLTGPVAGALYFVLGCAVVAYTVYHTAPGYRFLNLPGLPAGQSWSGVATYLFIEPLDSLGFTLILAGLSFGGRHLQALFSTLPARLFGIISFSVYLWHVPMLGFVGVLPGVWLLPPTHRYFVLLGGVLIRVIPMATFIYLLVEKPFMLMVRKSARKAPQPAVAPAVAVSAR